MRKAFVLLILLAVSTSGQQKLVKGKVTYIAAGTVYTSLGRETGIQDSSKLYVVTNADTVGVLQVFAVSSKSSACQIVNSRRSVEVGFNVIALVSGSRDTSLRGQPSREAKPLLVDSVQTEVKAAVNEVQATPLIQLRGRISAQYYMTRYGDTDINLSQPGIVVSLQGKVNHTPLKFEIYGNLRTLSYGSASPLSKNALNQSHIYRLSLDYDDGTTAVSIGRIVPLALPSIGQVDGALLSAKFSSFTVGTTAGFQPSYSLRGIMSEYKKFAVFVQSQPRASSNPFFAAAYSRTYFRSQLDREVASAQLNIFTWGGFSLHGQTEVDIRRKSGDRLTVSPSLTSLFFNTSYRLTNFLSLGIGADASRPFYSFSSVRSLADSLLERRLRSGLNVNATLSLPGGIAVYNTYNPRTSDSGFAGAYSDYVSISFADILSSGINMRSNLNVNRNELTTSRGYGVNIERNFGNAMDLNVRYQQSNYTQRGGEDRHMSRSLGADLFVSLWRWLTVVMSYDRPEGYGAKSQSLFAEVSLRF